MNQKRILAVQHANGKLDIACPNCGNPMVIEKNHPSMKPLYYCEKCGEFTNDDPRVPVVEAQLPEDDSVDTGL